MDWWHAYRYGYNHADSTPWYLVAGDYLRASGDAAFVRESWPSIAAAWRWCQGRDSDGDGLMDIAGAGLGALEFGQYTGIYTDCWATRRALSSGVARHGRVGRRGRRRGGARRGRCGAGQGQAALEQKFCWRRGIYAYGITAGGEQVRDLTPGSAAALAFGLAEPARSARMLRRLGGAETATDWGFRTLSARSPLYQPLSYNYGGGDALRVGARQHRPVPPRLALPGWAAPRRRRPTFDHGPRRGARGVLRRHEHEGGRGVP